MQAVLKEYFAIFEVYLECKNKCFECAVILEQSITKHLMKGCNVTEVILAIKKQNNYFTLCSVGLKKKTRKKIDKWICCVNALCLKFENNIKQITNVLVEQAQSAQAAIPKQIFVPITSLDLYNSRKVVV